jgi:hypothetical protein
LSIPFFASINPRVSPSLNPAENPSSVVIGFEGDDCWDCIEGTDDDDDMLLVCCCYIIDVLAVVIVLPGFSVLLVSFDGAALHGEYDFCVYK